MNFGWSALVRGPDPPPQGNRVHRMAGDMMRALARRTTKTQLASGVHKNGDKIARSVSNGKTIPGSIFIRFRIRPWDAAGKLSPQIQWIHLVPSPSHIYTYSIVSPDDERVDRALSVSRCQASIVARAGC